MTKHGFSVAIDGPAGAGKSTIARSAARALSLVYLDTGAFYRTIAYAALSKNVDCDNLSAMEEFLSTVCIEPQWDTEGLQHMIVNGEDVTASIRSPQVSQMASVVAAIPAVRAFLLDSQRKVARNYAVIMDGRDIGTVVLPDADVKIFLTASAEVRAKRRWLELQQKNAPDTYEQVLQEMIERDLRDTQREIAPLRQAEDAILLDTSDLDRQQSIDAVVDLVREAMGV